MPKFGQTAKRKNKSKLFYDINQLDEKQIETILCGGRTLDEMPSSENPFFILKWGPPGSGKSSERVVKQIEQLGVPSDEYVDYTPDKVVESLMGFRKNSTLIKLRNLRIEANAALHESSHIKTLLQTVETNDRTLRERIRELINKGIPAHHDEFMNIRKKIIYNGISKTYKKYRQQTRNRSGRTIRDKMESFLRKALAQNKHISYETMGSGYGEGDTRQLRNQFTGMRFTSSRAASAVQIFRNTWESLLGELLYNDEHELTGFQRGRGSNLYIPENYKIVVVYPILPVKEIQKRASLRATKQLVSSNSVIPVGDTTTFSEYYLQYFKELFTTIFGRGTTITGIQMEEFMPSFIREKLLEESEGRIPEEDINKFINFLKSIKNKKIEDIEKYVDISEDVLFPLYRIIPPEKITAVAEEAFQYAVDYFLKQYILLGRIKGVIYISNV
jgi:hypothetical protein